VNGVRQSLTAFVDRIQAVGTGDLNPSGVAKSNFTGAGCDVNSITVPNTRPQSDPSHHEVQCGA